MDIKDLPAGLAIGDDALLRCWWCVGDPLYQRYHDDEWGRPVGDDRRLFEVICLEAFQSGLSWLTILRKREGFRRAFADWHIATIARFDERDVERLMADASIVRTRPDRGDHQQRTSLSGCRRALWEPRGVRLELRARGRTAAGDRTSSTMTSTAARSRVTSRCVGSSRKATYSRRRSRAGSRSARRVAS